jgi:hypothetical protein
MCESVRELIVRTQPVLHVSRRAVGLSRRTNVVNSTRVLPLRESLDSSAHTDGRSLVPHRISCTNRIIKLYLPLFAPACFC